MGEINPPLYLDQDEAYGADELGLPYRDIMGEGVVGADDLEVTDGGTLKSSIAAGAAWVTGDDDPDAQPCYRVRNDAAVLLQHDAADATNDRIDLVIAEVLDAAFSGVSKLWQLRAVKGTPAATPAVPALPNNAIPLAEVTIPAGSGTLGTITDRRELARVGSGRATPAVKITTSDYSDGPPADPKDGDIWVARDVEGSGHCWQFVYIADWTADAYKWHFIGGPDLVFSQDTSLTANSASYGSGTNSGGTVAATEYFPTRSGMYRARASSTGSVSSAGASAQGGVTIGGFQFNGNLVTIATSSWLDGLYAEGEGPCAVGSAILPIYAVNAGVLTITNRRLVVAPSRVI